MKDIHNISDKELVKTLTEKQLALRDFKFNISNGKSKNVKEGREIRKEIAQILTQLSVRNNASVTVVAAAK